MKCEYLFSVDPGQSHARQCTCMAKKTVIIFQSGRQETRHLCEVHAENTVTALTWRGHGVKIATIK